MRGNELLTIAVMTIITVLAWIAFDVYHTSTTSAITDVQQELMTPLSPKFSTKGVEFIMSRPVQ